MKLRWVMFWFDCPQIRWEYGDYEYSFWLWGRRKGEWPNFILGLCGHLTDGSYEYLYPNLPPLKIKDWYLWKKRNK